MNGKKENSFLYVLHSSTKRLVIKEGRFYGIFLSFISGLYVNIFVCGFTKKEPKQQKKISYYSYIHINVNILGNKICACCSATPKNLV